jgi:hypothetical protein
MSIRRFFWFAFVAVVLAVTLHITASSQFGQSMRHRARATASPEPDRAALRAAASRYSTRGHIAMYVGAASAVGSVVFVIISARRKEPAIRSVVFGLLASYLLLQLVLV